MSNKRPNILFIMSDDHGANAISAYKSRLASVFETPNIDRIANAVFSQVSERDKSRFSNR